MEEVETWLKDCAIQCGEHSEYKRGCALCDLARTVERAAFNAIRFNGKVERTRRGETRIKLENKIELAEGPVVWMKGAHAPDGTFIPPHWAPHPEKGRRWVPDGKCACGKKCRCSEMRRFGFKSEEHRIEFIDDAKEKLADLG